MRDFKGMKRQRGRNRNGGGGGNGGKPQHNTNRAFDSNGPEGIKVRGAAQGVYEKYQQLARDAQTSGDRVLAENYLQHAEHYFRLMRAMQPQRPLSEIIGRDQFVSGYDIDFEDESGAEGGVEPEAENADGGGEGERERQDRFDGRRDDFRQGQQRPREDRFQNDRPSSDRPREERFQNDRSQNDRSQTDRPQNDRPREDRFRDDRPRSDRPRDERPKDDRAAREDRPRYNRDDRPSRFDRQDRPERDPMSVVEPEATPLTPEPVVAAQPAPMLRADDGEMSHAPAFLQLRPSEPREVGAEEARPRPRPRRRAPRTVDSGEAPSVPAVAPAEED